MWPDTRTAFCGSVEKIRINSPCDVSFWMEQTICLFTSTSCTWASVSYYISSSSSSSSIINYHKLSVFEFVLNLSCHFIVILVFQCSAFSKVVSCLFERFLWCRQKCQRDPCKSIELMSALLRKNFVEKTECRWCTQWIATECGISTSMPTQARYVKQLLLSFHWFLMWWICSRLKTYQLTVSTFSRPGTELCAEAFSASVINQCRLRFCITLYVMLTLKLNLIVLESFLFSKDFYSSRAMFRRRVYEIGVRRSIYWGPTSDRPTSHLAHIGEISNGHISARGHPIHFMFGSTLGFLGFVDRMALFPVSPNPRWRRYLCGGSSDLRRVWY